VAKNFTETILRGDPDEVGIVKQAVKVMVEGLIPHSSEYLQQVPSVATSLTEQSVLDRTYG
jgi:hypothetical protein